MMTAKAVRAALNALNGQQIEALAKYSEVPVPTIYKVRNGDSADPRSSTIEKLSPVLMNLGLVRPAPEGSEGQPIPPADAVQAVRVAA